MTGEISSVGVIGLGTMGAGIVEVFAKAGIDVVAVDGSAELAERGKGFLVSSLERQVKRGKLEPTQRDEIAARASFTHELGDLKDVDLVIEAVPERLEIKTAIFTALDNIVRDDAVLATNTSSLSITAIAAATKHPQRVVGMHFFNPAPVLQLVEVITTLLVDQAVVDRVRDVAVTVGKKPVVVGDRAGFVANALLITYLARAIRTYETGHVSREDLDDAARVGIGFPMGPLVLSDLIGLDVVKEVCDVLYEATKEPSAAPPALLQQLVAAGRLGRKTGRGFYDYDAPQEPVLDRDSAAHARRIAVFADTEQGRALADTFKAAGLSAQLIDEPLEGDLADVDLVVWALTEDDGDCACGCGDPNCAESGCEDCEEILAANAWRGELIASLPAGAPLAFLDPQEALLAGTELPDGAPVVAVNLHAPTKAGQLAEVVVDPEGSDTAQQYVSATFAAAGIRTIKVRPRPGYVVDALLFPHLNDAAKMVDSGYATVDDVDTAMVYGCGYPQGPFAYIAQYGPGPVIDGLVQMYDASRDPALWPSLLLEEAEIYDQSHRD